MWTWSHLMVTTIVLGPSPAAYLGAVLPDAFDYLNWINNFGKKKVNTKLLLKDEKKFNKHNNSGALWDIDQIFHSFTSTGISLYLTYYFYQLGDILLFSFFAAWSLHILTDYLTHTDQFYPLFPFSRKIGIKLGLTNYNPGNLKVMLTGDAVLFLLTLLRLYLIH